MSTRDSDQSADGPILDQLFEDSPVPIAILDAHGRARRMNDAHNAFLAAFGAGAQALMHGLDDLRTAKAGHAEPLRRALSGEVVEYELSLPPPDAPDPSDSEAHAIFRRLLVPVRGPGGAITTVVSFVHDVTAERRAEQERERFRDRMLHAQKLESLGLLAGGVAHDFNNLLVSVLGHASLLLHALPGESPLRRHALAIETAATRAGEVARQMLAYAGRGPVRHEHVDLSALVHETAELLRVSVPRQAELELSLPADTPLVLGDPTQLRQVVLNLITNAAEALPEGRGSIALSSGELQRDAIDFARCLGAPDDRAQRFAFVEVRDSGSGMDAATIARIFDPFFTTKATGRGLGLSAVLGIVRSHRGALIVDSEPGRGTAIRVLLPVSERMGNLRAVPSERPASTSGGGSLALIVDDESEIRVVTRSMLETLGYEVITADSGEEAITACSCVRFAIVLLDMTMPGLDGSKTLLRLRQEHASIPVLLMSGYEAPSGSTVPFLQKPFSLADLEHGVQTAIEATRGA